MDKLLSYAFIILAIIIFTWVGIIFLPFILSYFFINFIGLYTNSAIVFVICYIFSGLFIMGSGFFLFYIIGGEGIVFTLTAGMVVLIGFATSFTGIELGIEYFSEDGFNYEKNYENYENWGIGNG